MNHRHSTYKLKEKRDRLRSRIQSLKVTKAFKIDIVKIKINIVIPDFKTCPEALRK